MNHRFARLMAASLVLVAFPHAGMSAALVRLPVGDVEILVDGAPQPRYEHDGRSYLEALKGRRFLVLPHPKVAEYEQRRAADRENWLGRMRAARRKLTLAMPSAAAS